MKNSVMVAAGGTGGHVYPALTMARFLAHQGHDVIFVTDHRGQRFVPQEEDTLTQQVVLPSLSMRGLPGIIQNLHRTFRQWSPLAVWGFGGGMTVMPLLMASWYGASTAIHQSDCVIGRANGVLAPWVRHRFSAFPMTKGRYRPSWTPVGMPIRDEFQALSPHTHVSTPLRILIVGGSQGAHVWSTLWPHALALLSSQERSVLHVRHQCPAHDIEPLKVAYAEAGLAPEQWSVAAFFHDMPAQLAWSHVVFARAGASTLAELALAARPAVLVPYPQATQNHQWYNATQHLTTHPGWIMPQDTLSPEALAHLLRQWIDAPEKLCHDNKYSDSPLPPLSACAHMYHVVFGSLSS